MGRVAPSRVKPPPTQSVYRHSGQKHAAGERLAESERDDGGEYCGRHESGANTVERSKHDVSLCLDDGYLPFVFRMIEPNMRGVDRNGIGM